MKPFDFNVHLVPSAGSVDVKIGTELDLSIEAACECYRRLREQATISLSGVNLMLFNQSWSRDAERLQSLKEEVIRDFPSTYSFTQLVDLSQEPDSAYFVRARQLGLRAIKFHCYVQEISEKQWPAVRAWTEAACSHGLVVCVDASYGSLGMYEYDNLRLVAYLARHVPAAKIVVLHSGGLRVLEAWLLAESAPNIWLETSFSLSYYLGTRVEEDFVTAYRRLGVDRIIYASDYPYIDFERSLLEMRAFLGRHGFSPGDTSKVLCTNALGLIGSR